jgi:hypothetical protein
MTETRNVGGATVPRQGSRRIPAEPSGWVGWIVFAAVMMLMLGTFHVIQGFVSLFQDSYYLVPKSGLTVHVDYTAWGWTQLIIGAVVLAAGIGLFTGRMWARIIGVTVAFLSAILNVGFLSAYPLWSAIMIAVDVLIIWALTVHGAEMKQL